MNSVDMMSTMLHMTQNLPNDKLDEGHLNMYELAFRKRAEELYPLDIPKLCFVCYERDINLEEHIELCFLTSNLSHIVKATVNKTFLAELNYNKGYCEKIKNKQIRKVLLDNKIEKCYIIKTNNIKELEGSYIIDNTIKISKNDFNSIIIKQV